MLTWKDQKIDYLELCYGDVVNEWSHYSDDRKLYVNTYKMIIEAVESLDDNPKTFVKCAMNRFIDQELNTLSKIRDYFLA